MSDGAGVQEDDYVPLRLIDETLDLINDEGLSVHLVGRGETRQGDFETIG